MIKRALISVWDKTGVIDLAKFLLSNNIEILSTGGTKSLLKENGIDVTSVSDLTGFGSVMGGRVKTLHPKVFGGILADRDNNNHIEDLKNIDALQIDLVIVNLYPFVKEAVKNDLPLDKAIEFIDIGGPSMIRAAAKNNKSVISICSPDDYNFFMDDYLSCNGIFTSDVKLKYAIKVFDITSRYDTDIYMYLSSLKENQKKELPDNLIINISKSQDLRYGENPHQKAAYYTSDNTHTLWNQIQGKKLSYNNYNDIESAISIVNDFKRSSCSIIKHANPCGFAVGDNLTDAYIKAVSCDPVSYFGGIIGFNKIVDFSLAKILVEPFLECIVAPGFDSKSLEIFKKKKNLRIIEIKNNFTLSNYIIKNVLGGFLLQERDNNHIDINLLEPVTVLKPDALALEAMSIGWKLVKYVKSNAVVFANNTQLLSVGAGQMSRVDSVKNAIRKIQETGLSLDDSIMASDAFFPFPDSLELAYDAGIKSIIQPGGSVKDSEVIDKANELGLSMVFTKVRHFYH